MAFEFFLKAISFCLLFFYSKSWAKLITTLPGQPANTSFKQYAGHIVTDPVQGRALFYYFVEADSPDPLSRPLTWWLNGGPGCSSVGFGAFHEHGPFQPGEDGLLVKNPYSWNLESNLLYVESPIGVGFSYSNTSSNYINWNDTTTAEDNLRFIINFLKEFPQYKNSDLFLAGESYAGHYIPQLVALLLEYNKQPYIEPIKLKAISLGNPLLDLDISPIAGDYLWSHGLISDETLMLEKTFCNDSKYLKEHVRDISSPECSFVFKRIGQEIGIDVGHEDIFQPKCLSNHTEQFKPMGMHGKIQATIGRRINTGDPCLKGRILKYLNDPQVQNVLHANRTLLPLQWSFCKGPLRYQQVDIDTNVIPLVANLLKESIPVLLYSGDLDGLIPLTQTRIIANNLAKDLNLVPITKYAPWYDNKQVGGWFQSFGEQREGGNVTYLTFATVKSAGHAVPFTSPSQALTLFRSFISGSPLPKPI